jgi:hypothetical protein
MHGRIAGNHLVYESSNATTRLRMTFDVTDPQRHVWTNEISTEDDPWRLIESYRITPQLLALPRGTRDLRP